MKIIIYNKRALGPTPPNSVYVGRPTKWGNPFSHMESSHAMHIVPSRAAAIRAYSKWIHAPEQSKLRADMRRELKGKHLICWCAPFACHAEIIRDIANKE